MNSELVKIEIENIEITPIEISGSNDKEIIIKKLKDKFKIEFSELVIIRKSLDARKKNDIKYKLRVVVSVSSGDAEKLILLGVAKQFSAEVSVSPAVNKNCSVLIIGAGPAGLFCALRLIEFGATVTIIERGKKIEDRDLDIALLKSKGILNTESNILFGEGGAGTYSDGKLTTRIHRGPIDYFFQRMVEHGAPESILYDAKPHIGTDLLSPVMVSIRKKIQASGSRIIFGERADSLILQNGTVLGVVSSAGTEYRADAVVFAIGHSARDTYEMLHKNSVKIKAKGFAVGVRVEHPSEFINKAQYGKFSTQLPPADYRLVYNDPVTKRGVYSFCMCPGGEVINSSSEDGMLCVNGMSNYKRDNRFSNSAIVTSISAECFNENPLEGIEFQRKLEIGAFNIGGDGYFAPAQTIKNFINKKSENVIKSASYSPGIVAADLSSVFAPDIREHLIRGFNKFDSILKGFSDTGICIGVETRTSSPVRIMRNNNFQSVSHKNLYPIGEGAGYAGGIVSSAVDGIRCADMILEEMS